MKGLMLASMALVVSIGPGASAIVNGQLDDFEDGTVQNWTEGAISPNPPTNISSGGPAGAGDNYLQNISSGGFGAGSRQVMFNQVQWTGDYLSAGIVSLRAPMANFGASGLSIRIAIEGASGTRYGSTTAFSLPADGQWYGVTFGLTATDLSLISGAASLNTVLASVGTLRILSAAGGAAWNGDAIAATLGVDDITAQGASSVSALPHWGSATIFAVLLASALWLLSLSRDGHGHSPSVSP